MARRGGGFGLVMLVVVMAIVLLLVAKSWKAMGSNVLSVQSPEAKEAAAAIPAPPPEGTAAPGRRQLESRLADAQAKTSAHTAQMKDALGSN